MSNFRSEKLATCNPAKMDRGLGRPLVLQLTIELRRAMANSSRVTMDLLAAGQTPILAAVCCTWKFAGGRGMR
jgi:hypothetical protein